MSSHCSSNVPVIYITGFGPFGRHFENESQKVVEKLISSDIESELKVKLQTEILDVAYDLVLEKIPQKWSALQPKLVIHIGVSELAKEVTLEKQAFNKKYIRPDVRQCIPCSEECLPGFPSYLCTKLDLERVIKEVKEKDDVHLKCILSDDPGTYLCGFIYYLSLAINNHRSLFIHVPMLKTVCEDPNEALNQLVTCIVAIIKSLYRQLEKEDTDEMQKVEVAQILKQQPGVKRTQNIPLSL